MQVIKKNTNLTRYNATKHGILRDTVTAYEQTDFNTLFDQLECDLKPKNTIERMLIERIVINQIKLERISKAEAELIKTGLDPRVETDIFLEMTNYNIIESEGYKPAITPEIVSKLDLYSRYETQAENRLYRAIQMIYGLKKIPV